MLNTNNVTNSGLFVRLDIDLGLLVYSPYTGLMYAVHTDDIDVVLDWLNSPSSKSPSDTYEQTLGAGWAFKLKNSRQISPNLLPDKHTWSSLPSPSKPILINWLITGRCPLACKYCWAEDLMRNDAEEPTRADIAQIAEQIISYHPLVVVLTGGDPLISPYLKDAIKLLSNHTGLIIDTSGYRLNKEHIKLFKQHNVAVRISLDSERPKVNEDQRPVYKKYKGAIKSGLKSTSAALSAICECLDAELSVTVQSVATKKTANDLLSLGDKLYRLGVKSWRVGKVAPSEANMGGYISLVGTHKDDGKKVKSNQSEGPYDYVFKELKEASANRWKHEMTVQVMRNNVPNAVVLVGPDGTYYTESNVSIRKIIIDPISPKAPNIEAIRTRVNLPAHAERYLNLTT